MKFKEIEKYFADKYVMKELIIEKHGRILDCNKHAQSDLLRFVENELRLLIPEGIRLWQHGADIKAYYYANWSRTYPVEIKVRKKMVDGHGKWDRYYKLAGVEIVCNIEGVESFEDLIEHMKKELSADIAKNEEMANEMFSAIEESGIDPAVFFKLYKEYKGKNGIVQVAVQKKAGIENEYS